MYVLSDGKNYIGLNGDSVQTTVKNVNKALSFNEEKKALNYLQNLKATLKKFNWQVVNIKDDYAKDNEPLVPEFFDYTETDLEKSGLDILEFFNKTIEVVSQLRDYAKNMHYLEQEYNAKILDVRHYKRDIKTKLSAVQLQRLEQFEIQLERERYKCKSNRVITEIFLNNLSRLENSKYIDVIKNVKESEYKPTILTYELLNEIVGKKTKKAVTKNEDVSLPKAM